MNLLMNQTLNRLARAAVVAAGALVANLAGANAGAELLHF